MQPLNTRARADAQADSAVGSPALQPHPAAELFPLMTGPDFDALVADIREHGLREPIILHEGQILDGRHRYKACQQIGIEPVLRPWDGDGTPEAFVISLNLHRRHLNESQRGMVAAKLANMPAHRPEDKCANLRTSQEEAAEELHVSRRTVQHSAVVRDKGVPELVKAVEDGHISVSVAAQLATFPKDRQRDIVTAAEPARAAREAVAKTKASVADLPQRQSFMDDPDAQAEADAAARDLEIERDERIALAGADGLVAENDALRKQIAGLDRRIAGLIEDLGSAKYREKMWEKRARALGWKGRDDA